MFPVDDGDDKIGLYDDADDDGGDDGDDGDGNGAMM